MFVFLPVPGAFGETAQGFDSTLDVAESAELEFGYRAVGVGNELSAHPHAAVELDQLFPSGRGDDGVRPVAVRS